MTPERYRELEQIVMDDPTAIYIELLAAAREGIAAREDAESLLAYIELLCAGIEDGGAVYWVHGKRGMFYSALDAINAARAK